MKNTFLLYILLVSTIVTYGQKYTISGYISDKETGERLISANVYEKQSLLGTTANTYGYYSISLPKGEVSLIASFIGYQPQEFKINLTENISLNIELELRSDELGEVSVIGNAVNKVEETQMSVIDIPIQKLQKIPVILGEADVLKVIQLLPGVQSGTEGTSGIYVRGGGSDQNLFLLDGVPVYNASHLLGFFSVFNPDAMKSVKLYKGGFPARFGGRLSSVVDISMKDGNMKKIEGNFSIGAISSKLEIDGPIIKDKTSFMFSGRRTYLDIMAQPVFWYVNYVENTGSGEKTTGGAYFHDYNLKINHIFNNRSRLYLSGYFGKDKGYGSITDNYSYTDSDGDRYETNSETEFGLSWGNTIGSLRWNYLLTPKLFSNTTVTYSKYIFDTEMSMLDENVTEDTKFEYYMRYYSGIEDIAGKIDFDYFPSPNHFVKFGTSYSHHHFTPGATNLSYLNEDEEETEIFNLDSLLGQSREINANEFLWYAEDDIKVSSRLNINAGLHLSLFLVDDVNYLRLQPRLSIRFKANDNWSLKASYSRMAQHVHLLTTSGISMPTDLWLPVTENFKPPISDQVAIGTAINLPKDFSLTVEVFYKTMKNLIEYKEGASFMGSSSDWESKVESGEGWSYGAEVMLEKTVGKTTGWIGYTWSKTERLFENLNFGNPFPAKYDRRHDISIALTHEFSKNFDIGCTWVYGTGNAVTLSVMDYPQLNAPGLTSSSYYTQTLQYYSGRNSYRMPAYNRLDLGVNFHKKKKHGVRTWNISVYNAYNRKNPFMLMWDTVYEDEVYNEETGEYTQNEGRTALMQFSLFPIIPSVSYSFKF